jgi:hypothetical protein
LLPQRPQRTQREKETAAAKKGFTTERRENTERSRDKGKRRDTGDKSLELYLYVICLCVLRVLCGEPVLSFSSSLCVLCGLCGKTDPGGASSAAADTKETLDSPQEVG